MIHVLRSSVRDADVRQSPAELRAPSRSRARLSFFLRLKKLNGLRQSLDQSPRFSRLALNSFVRLARFFRAWRRQQTMQRAMMSRAPRTMRRICHHSNLNPSFCFSALFAALGSSGGMETGGVADWLGTTTNSARQTPSPATVPEPDPQSTVAHLPARRTALSLAQVRHPADPPVEHEPQDESHGLHVPEEPSKYSVLLQVGTQRPALVRMGELGGQVLHWLKLAPEQVAQSAWQGMQVPFAAFEKELVGQEETHCPLKADWPEEQVRQKLGLPAQVAHPLVQAVHRRQRFAKYTRIR